MKEKILGLLLIVVIFSALGITGTIEFEQVFPTQKVIVLFVIMVSAIIAIILLQRSIKRREEGLHYTFKAGNDLKFFYR